MLLIIFPLKKFQDVLNTPSQDQHNCYIGSKLFILFSLLAVICSCSHFPYSNYIEEQVRLYDSLFQDKQKTIRVADREISFKFHENSQSPYAIIFIHGSPGSWRSNAHFMKTPLIKRLLLYMELRTSSFPMIMWST